MKKNLILFFCFFILSGSFAVNVPVQTARQVAKNFYHERLLVHQKMEIKASEMVISSEFTEYYGDKPMYYVFNFSGSGFVIISADDICHPVIGYSFESTFSHENQGDNVKYWMDERKKEISENIRLNIKQDQETATEWNRWMKYDPSYQSDNQSATMDVAPLISSLWDQGFPYNVMCPAETACGSLGGHVTVGCVATAMAQIMYYWRWPVTGSGSHCYTHPVYGQQCADFGNTTYDWDGMNNQPNKECDPVALISYHAGVSVNMDYNTDGQCSSGAYQSSTPNSYKNYFKYASTCMSANKMGYSTSGWNSLLQGDLNAGQPIQYGGNGSGGGHSWVCDGYQTGDYYHMNWGWSGSSNGYFYLNNLNPSGYTFNNGQEAVVHIQPNTSQYPAYCSGTHLVQTYDFGSVEDGSGPVLNYQDNASCSWLIAPDDSIKYITLTFSRFATESADLVKIYDGGDATAPLLATLSGTPASMPTVTTTGPKMYITFNSSSSGNAQGWMANYTATPVAFCSSNTTLTEAWGTISDGSGRFKYRNTSNCKWKIMPPGASKIVLTVNSFQTEENTDKVLVYDLGTSQQIASWSGHYTTMPPPLISTTGGVMIMWGSNSTVRDEGWEISYSPMVGTETLNQLENLMVYPNPARDHFNVSFRLPKTEDVSMKLTSVDGKVVYSDTQKGISGDYQRVINVTGLQNGIYFLHIQSEDAHAVQKIVLQ